MAGEESHANSTQASSRANASDASGLSGAWSLVKTPEGRDEITHRSRGLDQRQRMVLLLVDGRRTISQIRNVASQVGASDSCLDDLLDMGLVALPAAPAVPAPTLVLVPAPAPEPLVAMHVAPTAAAPVTFEVVPDPEPVQQAEATPEQALEQALEQAPDQALEQSLEQSLEPEPTPAPVAALRTASSWPIATELRPTIVPSRFEPSPVPRPANQFVVTMQETLPPAIDAEAGPEPAPGLTSELFDEFVRANAQAQQDEGPTTTSASLRNGRIDSMMSTLFPLLESAFGALGRSAAVQRTEDAGLEEARRILVREVRAKAPVTGALTLVKLRRAMTREELLGLFDEVGSHISVPMRRLSTQQTLLHVRSLLDRPM